MFIETEKVFELIFRDGMLVRFSIMTDRIVEREPKGLAIPYKTRGF